MLPVQYEGERVQAHQLAGALEYASRTGDARQASYLLSSQAFSQNTLALANSEARQFQTANHLPQVYIQNAPESEGYRMPYIDRRGPSGMVEQWNGQGWQPTPGYAAGGTQPFAPARGQYALPGAGQLDGRWTQEASNVAQLESMYSRTGDARYLTQARTRLAEDARTLGGDPQYSQTFNQFMATLNSYEYSMGSRVHAEATNYGDREAIRLTGTDNWGRPLGNGRGIEVTRLPMFGPQWANGELIPGETPQVAGLPRETAYPPGANYPPGTFYPPGNVAWQESAPPVVMPPTFAVSAYANPFMGGMRPVPMYNHWHHGHPMRAAWGPAPGAYVGFGVPGLSLNFRIG
jgi:hypothetical protein